MISPNKPPPDETRGEWRSMGESNVLLSERTRLWPADGIRFRVLTNDVPR